VKRRHIYVVCAAPHRRAVAMTVRYTRRLLSATIAVSRSSEHVQHTRVVRYTATVARRPNRMIAAMDHGSERLTATELIAARSTIC
jgi:hypothetical protein